MATPLEVDLIELNHRFCDAVERKKYPGDHFDQVLFWSTYPDGQLQLRDWRIVKSPAMRPRRENRKWVCTWTDDGEPFRVEAPRHRETTTVSSANDPELLDRSAVPKISRISLWKTAR